MITQQYSYHLIECPVGVSSSHAVLVVSGRGVPHKTLTVFYEELQKTGSTSTILPPLLAFFSFLEQPEQHVCCSPLLGEQLPGWTYWAGPPSQIRAAIRAYLLTRWSCLTRAHGQMEEILLSPIGSEAAEIQHFLAALQQFYRFATARGYYWYEGNPAAAFTLPVYSRLWQALTSAFRSPAPRHASSGEEEGKEVAIQRNIPTSPRKEPALPALVAEAWIPFVPVSEPVATLR